MLKRVIKMKYSKNIISAVVGLLISAIGFAQDGISEQMNYVKPSVVSNQSFSFLIVGAEYSYEQKITHNSSVVFSAGINPNMLYFEYSDGESRNFVGQGNMGLGITVEPRLYTSLERRNRIGKSTAFNSSNFVSIKINNTIGSDGRYNGWISPAYGIRRVGEKLWYWEFTSGFGVGYYAGWDSFYFKPHCLFKVGKIF